jgi:hypothetical protein
LPADVDAANIYCSVSKNKSDPALLPNTGGDRVEGERDMSILGGILMAIGAIGMLIFGIQILIKAFKTSIGWGLGSLIVPFVALIFVFTHWAETKKPFLYLLLCLVPNVLGMILMFMGGAGNVSAVPQ